MGVKKKCKCKNCGHRFITRTPECALKCPRCKSNRGFVIKHVLPRELRAAETVRFGDG